MNTRFLLVGTLLGGVALFVWGAISNMVVPWPGNPLREFTDAAAVVEAIRANAPASGVYFAPQGLFAAVSFTPDLADRTANIGPMLVTQFATDLLAALLVCALLLVTGAAATRQRLKILGLAALVATASYIVPQWTWWGVSPAFTFAAGADLVIRFLVAGVVIGAVQDRWTAPAPGTAAPAATGPDGTGA